MTAVKTLLAVLALALAALPAQFAQAQESGPGGIDFERWTGLANRAEQVVEAAAASDSALRLLRAQLLDWRNRAIALQEPLQERVSQLESRMSALGGQSGAEQTPADEIAARRAELATELQQARAPLQIADEVARWASGLISDIDAIVSDRQKARFFSAGPTPLNPVGWPGAFAHVTAYFGSIRAEVADSLASEAQRVAMRQKLPAVLLLLAGGVFLLTYARRWLRRFAAARRIYGNREVDAGLASLENLVVQFVLPVCGIFLLAAAVDAIDLLLLHAKLVTETIPGMGAAIYGAVWLASTVFSDQRRSVFPVRLGSRWSVSVRRVILALGWVAAAKLFADALLRDIHGLDRIAGVVGFPILLIGSGLLFMLARRLSEHVAARPDDAANHGIAASAIAVLAVGARAMAVIAAMAGAVGYAEIARYFLFSPIYTLALFGAALSLQISLAGLLSLASLRLGGEESGRQHGLAFVVAGFTVFVSALPVLAIIWGASDKDLTELWVLALDGVEIGGQRFTVADFLMLFVVFAAGYMATRLVQSILSKSILPSTDLEIGVQRAIATGSGYVGITLATVLAVSVAGLDLTNLAIVAGALSVGIGFGLQTVVSNFVSGIILLIERPINVGDWIEAGGVSGTVKRISVRSTQIETFDRATVIVPNSDLISGQVVNWTLTNRICRTIVPVGVAYGTDPRRVEQLLLEIAAEHPAVLSDPPPSVMLMRFGADALEFELRAILNDTNQILRAKSDLNFAIAKRFEDENISIPFPQRDVWIRNADDPAPVAGSVRTENGAGD